MQNPEVRAGVGAPPRLGSGWFPATWQHNLAVILTCSKPVFFWGGQRGFSPAPASSCLGQGAPMRVHGHWPQL